MLTRKQHELLLFINERLESTGISPSFEEMKIALNLRSKSGIHRLILGLDERGFIRRLPHRARALEVLKLPTESGAAAKQEAASNVVRGDFAGQTGAQHGGDDLPGGAIEVPLLGQIAAGTPIEALQDDSRVIDVPGSMIGGGDHFALEIAGDSMIDAGILDGDVAVIRRGETADNGTIVVALIDDQEATLKRLRRKRGSIALEPANPAFETRIFGPDRVKVQGRLVGLLRYY
ncbi:MAG: transcriptional repressor LexA [Alphaproteobacteria bacterium]|jgi:repressor LexA|nr:transcriptional repressor LexA [Alphaproteobacteria bacterium]MDP6515534.1 transcriptional repressor LexA [Alphaproteobacteria bacterium]